MKKITKDQAMQALQENTSLESDHGTYYYHLHIKNNGKILPSMDDADESFKAEFEGDVKDDSYDWESPENEKFMDVVEELTDQANAYLDKWGK